MSTDTPTHIVALYDNLRETTSALNDLQTAGVPYPNIRMATHSNDEVNPAMIGTPLPADGRFWSLAVKFEQEQREKVFDVLRKYAPFVLGEQAVAPESDEVAQGRLAWGHYVFNASAASDRTADSAGTVGTTGIGNSGAFATGTERERA